MSERNARSSSRRDDTELYDMDLVVEGRKIKATSGVLAYNSSVFKALILNARISQQIEIENFDLMEMSSKRLKLEIPNTKYKDMKLMITSLQSIRDFKDLTGEEALRVLPLAGHYQIKPLIKICGKSLQASLVALQEEHGTGNIPVHDVMKYLSAADNHRMDKVRSDCIEELSYKSDPTKRRQILTEKHVSEKTKLKILEKLCNKIEDDYASNLKQIRHDMDKRCREIEQKRDEFLETIDTWKNDLQQEVDEIFKNTKSMHEKLLDEFHKKNIIEELEKSLKYSTNEFLTEQGHMNDRIQSLFETMETNDVIGELEASKMREDWEETQNNIKSNIETITKQCRNQIDKTLTVCSLDVQVKLASSCSLEVSVSKSFKEMEEDLKQSEISKVKLEEEKLAHEKTKGVLLKMKMKEHEINTWLKWAKPETNDDEKCVCFRHTKSNRCE